MLTHPTHDRLLALGLTGIAKALEEQRRSSAFDDLSFEERLGILVDREAAERDGKKLTSRLKFAALRQDASVEDLDLRAPRGAFPIDRLCRVMNVSPRGLRAFHSRPGSCRQRMDMVVLAHIIEQSRLSLGRYGRPRMTEELKEDGVEVGHRRVGRLRRENGIIVERTHKFKVRKDQNLILWIKFPDARPIAITRSTSHRTCWIATSRRMVWTRTEGPRSEMGG